MQISRHFSLEQLTRSETAESRGIDNTPPPEVLDNLRRLAAGLEQVQAALGHPLEISSAYRCAELNAAVGGALNSQHCQGLAADICCASYGTPADVALGIAESAIAFDQVILEFGRWVHVSFSEFPRGRILTLHDPAQGYRAGLWDRGGNRLA